MLIPSFQTIPLWLRLRNSKWKTISTVIFFDLQSHRPHWILHFFGQVLKPELWSWIRHICSLALMTLNVVSLLDWQNYLKRLGASSLFVEHKPHWLNKTPTSPKYSENNHKRSHSKHYDPFHFLLWRAFAIWILWVSCLDCGLNFTVKTVVTFN